MSRHAFPTAVVSPKAARALRAGGVWCYRTELLDAPHTSERGAIVDVVDRQQNFVGQAFYAQASPLALRLLTRRPRGEEAVDERFFERRIQAALERRRSLGHRDAVRLIHGEADLLPGLFVDRYGPALVLQTLSEGADARKERFAALLVALSGAAQVVLRDDGSGRDFERLPREKRGLAGVGPYRATYREGDNTFEVDLLEDMKTGAFLDQADNHLRAAELARGRGLDLFSYQGGFALVLASRCTEVLAVEQDAQAAQKLRSNAERNHRTNLRVEEANAFDVLRRLEREAERFDTVVLDPPGLAKRKEGVQTALRAYKELNLRALKCVAEEGVFITCSCSGKLARDAFEEMVLDAAGDAHRQVQILERRGAGIDHPVLGGLPETEYLKVLVLRVVA